ncbi:MAG: chorismate lyase [Chromatiales bacterium]|jgi:chorismate--pyruvate lyase
MAVFEAHWMTEAQLRFRVSNHDVRLWMMDRGSLTERLIGHCQGEFAVRLRRQGLDIPLWSESHLLGQPENTLAMIREVDLLCRGIPVVFARTIIPFASLRGRSRSLTGLGSRPLGAMLFRDPTTRRETVQYARIRPEQGLHTSATQHLVQCAETLQARRTLFSYKGRALLVNEIFLPVLFEPLEDIA